MAISKVIIVNLDSTENESLLREDIKRSLLGRYLVEEIDTDSLVIDASTDNVRLVVGGVESNLSESFVFVRRLRKNSDLPALFCRILKDRSIPFNDIENASHKVTTDKSYAIVALADAGLPVPRTCVTNFSGLKRNLSYILGAISFPCIIKGEGSKGEWVYKVTSREELLERAEDIHSRKECLLSVQELIPNTYDVRALYFGNKCIAAMRRTAASGNFLNNVSQGGLASPDKLSEEEAALCAKACKVTGIDFAGVDFIRTQTGIVFLEINKSPQLGGIRSVYKDLSVGSALQDYITSFESNS